MKTNKAKVHAHSTLSLSESCSNAKYEYKRKPRLEKIISTGRCRVLERLAEIRMTTAKQRPICYWYMFSIDKQTKLEQHGRKKNGSIDDTHLGLT
jgi:hypothetical protein